MFICLAVEDFTVNVSCKKTSTNHCSCYSYSHSRPIMFIVHRESKRNKTPNLLISSPNIDRFLKFFHCYTQQEICNNKIITDLTTSKGCRYTTLRNISYQKLHWPKAQQRYTGSTHTEENVTAVGEWTGWTIKERYKVYGVTFHSVEAITLSFRHAESSIQILWSCNVAEMPAGKLIEANCHARLNCSKHYSIMLSSFSSVIKATHISYTEKFAEWPTVSIWCNKE